MVIKLTEVGGEFGPRLSRLLLSRDVYLMQVFNARTGVPKVSLCSAHILNDCSYLMHSDGTFGVVLGGGHRHLFFFFIFEIWNTPFPLTRCKGSPRCKIHTLFLGVAPVGPYGP